MTITIAFACRVRELNRRGLPLEAIALRTERIRRNQDVSFADATHALKTFLKVMEEAQDMATVGAVGEVLDEVLEHASELLTELDEELSEIDRQKHARLFAAAPLLRNKLEEFRRDLEACRRGQH